MTTATRTSETVRLDKWLWAARFFKTRKLACEAINGGKVHLNGQRAKPGKEVRPGSRLVIHKGSLEWDIEVEGISTQRRPASEAQALYSETEESRERRQQFIREQKEVRSVDPRPRPGRPSKRDRRLIQDFLRKSG